MIYLLLYIGIHLDAYLILRTLMLHPVTREVYEFIKSAIKCRQRLSLWLYGGETPSAACPMTANPFTPIASAPAACKEIATEQALQLH